MAISRRNKTVCKCRKKKMHRTIITQIPHTCNNQKITVVYVMAYHMFRWKRTGSTGYTSWERRCLRQSTASLGVCSASWSSPRGGTWWSPLPPVPTNWGRSCSDCTPEVAQERGRCHWKVGHWKVGHQK